jgi:hypothetical protein
MSGNWPWPITRWPKKEKTNKDSLPGNGEARKCSRTINSELQKARSQKF